MSEIIIYEDCETDDLQRLLQHWYTEHEKCQVIYANSAGNLEARVSECVNNYSVVFVYVDVSPGNLETFNTYKILQGMLLDLKDSNIFILPILGAEYYFICSLFDAGILADPDLCAVIKGQLSHLDYLKKNHIKNPLKYFSMERFFKYVLKMQVYPCIAQKKPSNMFKGIYYSSDCKFSLHSAPPFTLMQKSEIYLQRYPIIPGAIDKNCKDITPESLVKKHRDLVNQYNSFADCMLASCTDEQKQLVLHIPFLY